MRLPIRVTGSVGIALLAACSTNDEASNERDPAQWLRENPLVTERTWATTSELVCKPDVLDVCGPKKCAAVKPVSFVVWKPASNEYQRCDGNGCDTYTPTIAYSGSFTNLALPSNGVLFKLSTDRHFVEVATLMGNTFVYRGRCERR